MLLEAFTRKETLTLTKCSSSRLIGLEAHELIIPTRIGGVPFFTWEQLISIRLLEELQDSLKPKTRHAIARFLQACNYDQNCHHLRLAQIGDRCFWLREDWKNFAEIMRSIEGDRKRDHAEAYAVTVLPSLASVVADIWHQAEVCQAIDFESFKARAKVKPGRLGAIASAVK
jgi:hypothetical protein